ncbi:MAG: molybdopterin-dependent oxidoreductase [Planctomycetes bacterium]|nr:molybdopterin-dependent oxidoreductase [Planctomycetota bacterium]
MNSRSNLSDIDRRQFLVSASAAGFAAWISHDFLSLSSFAPQDEIANPLATYPARDWEKVYRDQYHFDSTFSWVCSPNDTHACRVKAYVRNGVITRLGNDYNSQDYCDLYGNHATANWNPRQCAKGYTFHRRVYGPYRLKYPMVRKGWREWADAGFPYLTAENRKRYRFDSRGTDQFMRLTWDEANDYIAKGYVAIAAAYSGDEGAKRLLSEGYPKEMVSAMEGAGTRTLKFRGGMGLLGVFGKYGAYRLSNTMALLDESIRKVPHSQAKGGRNWSNYTWHGDQAPGHPWVHGLQTSDCDFNDLRFSRLIVMDGKNLVENKMADSHWFIECMERGAKVVVIAPEYGAPSTKADYWMPIRPATDAALFLGVTKIMIERGWFDEGFVKSFTDFPLLLRTDTLTLLSAKDVFKGHVPRLKKDGVSFKKQNLTDKQYEKLGDFVIFDRKRGEPVALSRDEVGAQMAAAGLDPVLEAQCEVTLLDGTKVQCLTVWSAYRTHLADYDLDSVHEITGTPKNLIEQLAQDLGTIRPAAIHQGEGINHWFHATEMNRAAYLPLLLTGNIGKPGTGCHTWAGNYKAALFQGSPWTGPGFKGWVAEDPFEPNLDPTAHGKDIHAHAYTKDEEPAYWNHGDRPLIVDTPKAGRKVFTGASHMPTPTKSIYCCNVNLFNNAKHAYEMFKNVNPKIDMIITADINMTATVEYADFALPANTWVEFEGLEVTASCSNPFLQIWKGGIKPLFDTRDDLMILAGIAKRLSEVTSDRRIADYWKFALEGKREVYIQRLLDTCTTTAGYKLEDIMAGKYGPPGGALMLFRTYPRIPFWEQVHEDQPFFTSHGRLQAYSDVPEAIEYGENFIVHREGPEATPYLPNVIVSSNPLVRPVDYGVVPNARSADERTVFNVKMPWREVKATDNALWKKGYRFWCLTPKTRHRVHSQWSDVDWHALYDSNFGDPYRIDRRTPGVSEHQLHMNPQAARDQGIEDGDYVYVDANPVDRPYVGATPDDPFYKVARCMIRVIYNPAYPYNIVMMKHAPYIATERSVKAHESRSDGLAKSEGTGYQANLRYGSQQSVTRNWHMPMHQTDTLFHKTKAGVGFLFGGEADNHAVNTVPKETLVRITKAEDGGLGGKGIWQVARTGKTPTKEGDAFRRYLQGGFVRRKDA